MKKSIKVPDKKLRTFIILHCPTCKTKLKKRKTFLTCANCGENFPIVDGIIILLSQKQLSNFFSKEPIGKYLSGQREIIASSQNFMEGLKEIVTFVKRDDFQSKYAAETCRWEGYLGNPEAEHANKLTTEILVDQAHITEANKILDWPTGKGCFIRTILNKVKKNALIVCLDIDFLELASLKVFLERSGKRRNILFVNADARQMPFNNGVFDAVTAWGGFIEVPESQKAIAESFRVLTKSGFFAGDGEIYKENSESMKVAKKLGISSLATKERIEKCLVDVGFSNIFIRSIYEGYDKGELPNEERASLPTRGDWFGLVVASGQKQSR